MRDPLQRNEFLRAMTRRNFLGSSSLGLGSLALGGLLDPGACTPSPRVRRVIYLFQSGAPSQVELFDHKPGLDRLHGTKLPDSIRKGQRLTGMTSGQKKFPVVRSIYPFRRYGESGMWMGETLPYIGAVADRICMIRTLHTEAINHDPAITFFQTGHQQPGRPSIGSWFSYGLGSESEDLPAYVVLLSRNTMPLAQPIYSRLWGSGFLPANHQGVKLRPGADPVLYLNDPAGDSRGGTRQLFDGIAELNRLRRDAVADPAIDARIRAYELAFRMQTSVPDLTDLSDEPASTFELYGEQARVPGSFAANCLLARRLAERGVRFIQLFHRGWDSHSNLPKEHRQQCLDTDRGSGALVADLARRGLLEDTLVVWGGEFGRTVYGQGNPDSVVKGNFGRDHHPRCFSMWLAGGGVKGGHVHGETDDFSYNIVRDPVHIHDLHATILHCCGVDHEALTHRFQGRDYRLTDVHGRVVTGILS